MLDTPRRPRHTRRPGANLGTTPGTDYRISSGRPAGRHQVAEAGRRGGHRGRGKPAERAQATGYVQATGPAQATGQAQVTGPAQEPGPGSQPGRRRAVVAPLAVIVVIAVAAVATTAYLRAHHPHGIGGNAAFEALPNSSTLTLLAAERQQLVDMNAATKVMASAAKPQLVSPSQVQSNASGSGSTSGGAVTWAAPDPAGAQAIAKAMLPSFGWDQTTQYSCLVSLWNRESGWVYDAENTSSGAYGIPQALPAFKMASAGADYLTNPATQIKWGLGYIQGKYGTPCGAWNFELANGFY